MIILGRISDTNSEDTNMVRNTVEVKQLNKEKIIEAVQSRESCTKAEIARETGLSVATCGTILNEMSESGELVRMDQEDAVIGRPATLFAYNRDYRHVSGDVRGACGK